tara:strand:+ start:3478 stop:3693 length:216 start_codon:yes stop_codon:yes gene_type:complete
MKSAADMTLEQFKAELAWLNHRVRSVHPLAASRDNPRSTRTYLNAKPGKKVNYKVVSLTTVQRIQSHLAKY